MSPVPRPRTLFGALFLVLVGCRTAAPPAAPEPLPEPPPRPAPVAEPPAEAPPPVKTPRYEPVPAGVYESRSTYPQAGVTEWRMTSGARLVFRPSRTSPRSVTLYAFAPGGFAAVPDDLAGAALALSTAGGAAAGADAAVQPAVREREALLLGTASTGALEALFQQVRRAMGAPEAPDPQRLSVREGLEAALAGMPLGRWAGDAGALRAVHDRLFGDPRRFTFVLVGDSTPEAIEAAAARVLPRMRPSLQALLGEADTLAVPPRIPVRPERRVLPPHDVPAAAAAFRGTVEPGYDALAELDVLAGLLEDVLEEDEIRVSAEVFFDAGVGEVRVVAEDVDPDAFEADLLAAVGALRAAPPSARALAEARERRREAHEAALDAGSGWLPWLVRLYRYDHDVREALRYARRLGGVTAAEVHARARAVLDPTRFVLVVRPEG